MRAAMPAAETEAPFEPQPGSLARDLQITALQVLVIANLEKRGLTIEETRTLGQHIRAASRRAPQVAS